VGQQEWRFEKGCADYGNLVRHHNSRARLPEHVNERKTITPVDRRIEARRIKGLERLVDIVPGRFLVIVTKGLS